MSADAADRDLETRIETLRRDLAGLVVALSNVGLRLGDLTNEFRARRQANKVIALDRRRRGNSSHDPDILADFHE